MKNDKEKKVPLPINVPQWLFDEIDHEAKEKGVNRTDVAVYRLQHYPIPLTPALMMELQNGANKKYEELKDDQPEEAIEIQRKVMELWNSLK